MAATGQAATQAAQPAAQALADDAACRASRPGGLARVGMVCGPCETRTAMDLNMGHGGLDGAGYRSLPQ
jgi:hypothetical protein